MLDFKPFQTVKISTVISYKYLKSLFFYSYFPIPPQQTHEAYLDLFCKKSDTAKHYVQKWMPIVAASQSVKGNEKEKELLLSWVDVVDYE